MLATKAALEVQKLVSIKSEQLTTTFEVLVLEGIAIFMFEINIQIYLSWATMI